MQFLIFCMETSYYRHVSIVRENAEVLARLKDLSKGAAKKVVRKPQPKLDPTRLTGERGIPILPKLWKDIKFRGKGHEAQDLEILMRQMEHWAHRLFPKMPFDEVIERTEKLGSKKEVQTCLKKMRLGMPILDDDFVGSDQDDNDVVRRGEEAVKERVQADDMWDELLREEAELTGSQVQTETGTSGAQASSPPAGQGEPVFGTPVAPLQKVTDTPGGFTPEQLERIEKNKQLARERRLKKMGQCTPGSKAVPAQTAANGENLQSSSPSKPDQTMVAESKAVDKWDSETVEGNSHQIVADSQSLKPLDGGGEQSESTKNYVDRKGSEELDEMDTEMSEVLEKGPSQNINVAHKPQDDAQNRHTGPAGGSDLGLTFDSGSSKGADTLASESDKGLPSEEMSEVSKNLDVGKNLEISNVTDSQEMSEIIEQQEDVKVVLKEKSGNLDSEQNLSAEILKLPGEKLDTSVNYAKENIQKCEDKFGKERDMLLKENLHKVNGNTDLCVDEFDDELTEDQLMDTLES